MTENQAADANAQVKAEEHVLCVPATIVEEMGLVAGYTPIKDVAPPKVNALFSSKSGVFKPRSHVETDESFLQLIPYVVFVCGSEVWAYRRRKGEERLAGKLSVGVGGHINPEDGKDKESGLILNPYFMGLMRELAEEVGEVPDIINHAVMGFIYDPSNAVGRVHLGVLHVIVIKKPEINAVCKDIESAGFMLMGDLLSFQSNNDQLENWSRIAIDDALWPRFLQHSLSWANVLKECGIEIPDIMGNLGNGEESVKDVQARIKDIVANDVEEKLEYSCKHLMRLFRLRDKIMKDLYPDSEKTEEVLEADRLTKVAHKHWLGHWSCSEVQPIKSGGIKISWVSIWCRLDGTGAVIHNESNDDRDILVKLQDIDLGNPITANDDDCQIATIFMERETEDEEDTPKTADDKTATVDNKATTVDASNPTD